MTDERELAEARAEVEKLRTELSRMRSGVGREDLIRIVGHELRAPLAPMLTAVQLLDEDPSLPPDAKRWIGVFRRNLTLEARLVDDTLDFLRIGRGQLTSARDRASLQAIVTAAVEAAQPDAKQRNAQLSVEHGAKASDVLVDATRLEHGLWHVLRAALKTTSSGATVAVRTLDRDGALGVVVAQPEPGVDAATARSAVAALGGDDSAAIGLGGVGLALLYGRTLVTAAGATVAAHVAGSAAVVVEIDVPTTPATQPRPRPYPSAKPTVLLVDDHEDTLELLLLVLRERGFDVEGAGSVVEALSRAKDKTFDVLVSDLSLPDGTGGDLVAKLRAAGQTPRCIAVSGYASPDDVARSKSAGFVDHLAKPVATEVLEAAILGSRSTRD